MALEAANIPLFDANSFFGENEKIYIHLSTDFPDYVGVLHRHAFIEVVYILSGEAVHSVGDREYHVKSGDVTLINSGVPHKFTPLAGKERFVAYDLMFMPDFFDPASIPFTNFEALKSNFLFYSLFPEEENSSPDMYVSGGRYADYGSLFTRIHREYLGKEKGYIELIRAYLIELIIHLFRDIERKESTTLSRENCEMVKKAIAYIQENYHLTLSVDEVAAKVFLGPDYFRKLFKKVTGCPISAFQQQLRIDEACRLLRTTDEPIKDICLRIGYSDIKSFYDVFKKLVGRTPKEYRENR